MTLLALSGAGGSKENTRRSSGCREIVILNLITRSSANKNLRDVVNQVSGNSSSKNV